MGRSQRRKGLDHERAVAAIIRNQFPGSVVRRGLQSHGAYEPDVVVGEGAPKQLQECWIECQVSKRPSPKAKLLQAIRDIRSPWVRPVVVWRRHGNKQIYVTDAGGTVTLETWLTFPLFV